MSAPLSRLSVDLERPAPGLYNRITNPTGAGGSVAGWVTPVAGSTLASTNTTGGAHDHGVTGYKLIYTAVLGTSNYFYSLPFAVTPGEFIAARWKLPYCGRYCVASIEYLAGDKTTVLSVGGKTYGRAAAGSLRLVSAVSQIPGGSVYARIRFDLQWSWFNNASNVSPGEDMIIQDVEVACATTAAAIGSTRRNIVTNAGAEDANLSNAQLGTTNCAVARVTTTPRYETAAWRLTASAAASEMGIFYGNVNGSAVGVLPVVVGASVRPLGATAARQVRFDLQYSRTSTGQTGLIASSPLYNETAGAYVDLSYVFTTLPTDAIITGSRVTIVGSLASGEQHLVDGWQTLVGTSVLGTVFHHLTPAADGISYEPASGSSQNNYFGAVEFTFTNTVYPTPTVWDDVTGAHGELKITRRPLDASTLATTLKPNQLPAGADPDVKPGNGYRVLLDDEPLITAEILARDTKDSRMLIPPIAVSAADAGRVLTAASKPDGVDTLAALAWTLEDVGVPWSINGSSAQVTTPTTIASNPNAKAIDQIAMTRDLCMPAYSWVSRDGVTTISDAAHLSGTQMAVLDEDDCSYLENGYDVDSCINIVTVKALTMSGGTPVLTTYGPFIDQPSIDEWGEHPCTLTIQQSSPSAFNAQTVASALIAANKNPTYQALAVTVPLKRADQDAIALLDLYDLVRVQHAASGTDQQLRVVEVVHEITPAKWLVKLRFAVPGVYAIPQVIPEP